MPNDQLNYAIQLLQQGQNEQAQPILQTLIRANQQDMVAWSWYVKSCRTSQKRLEALELCLRFNPGNPKIIHAIHVLREKLLEEQIFDFTPAPQQQIEQIARPVQQPYPYAVVVIPETVQYTEPSTRQPARFGITDREVSRAFAWYDVWWMALSQPNMLSYTALLRDTNASPGRGYWWIFWITVITSLISEISTFAITHYTSLAYQLHLISDEMVKRGIPTLQRALEADVSGRLMSIATVLSIILIPLSGVFAVFWFIVGAAIYNVCAKLFGGTGDFARTVYLMAAYSAPLLILSGMSELLSLMGSFFSIIFLCVGIPYLIYVLRLHIAAIQAAHQMNGLRATLAILTPSIVSFIFLVIMVATLISAFPRR